MKNPKNLIELAKKLQFKLDKGDYTGNGIFTKTHFKAYNKDFPGEKDIVKKVKSPAEKPKNIKTVESENDVIGGPRLYPLSEENFIANQNKIILKEIDAGIHNRELDYALSKYGKKPWAQIRRLIEENRAIGIDLPERGQPLGKAISRMIKKIEPDQKKAEKLLNLLHQEEWSDFTGPLAGRVMEHLKKG